MKKFYFVLIVCLCQELSNAQIISTDENAIRAGEMVVKQQVDYKDPGSYGKNLLWDFTMLNPINESYEVKYFIPDSSKMDTLCGMEHRTRYYYTTNADTLWRTGYENPTTYISYTEPEALMRYPFRYGDSIKTYFEGTGQYGHRIRMAVSGNTIVKADATGELRLPKQTYTQALRTYTLRKYIESGIDSTEMEVKQYDWYVKGSRYPVFESIIVSTIDHDSAQLAFKTSFYYPIQTNEEDNSSATGAHIEISEIQTIFTEAAFLPNPVESDLTISYRLTRDAEIWFSVHNAAGIPLYSSRPQREQEGYQTKIINMSGWMTGAYTLYVHVDDMILQNVILKK